MKKFISKNYPYIIGVILFITFWWIFSIVFDVNNIIIPSPINTIKYIFKEINFSYLLSCIGSTFYRMIIGFVISIILSLILGTLANISSFIRKIIKPSIIALKSIPTATLIFLFLILINAFYAPVFVVIMVSFPILYELIVGGMDNIDKNLLDNYKLDGNNILKNILYVKIPLMMPYFIVGISSSFGLAFKIEIMAEVITGSTKKGIGSAITSFQRVDPTNMIPIFAYSLIAIIFILIITLISNIVVNKIKSKYLKES